MSAAVGLWTRIADRTLRLLHDCLAHARSHDSPQRPARHDWTWTTGHGIEARAWGHARASYKGWAVKPPKPCLERLANGLGCPRYALEGDSRCEEHRRLALKMGLRSPGTTAPWRRARRSALERARWRCETCGRNDADSRAAGLGGLHVHHLDGRGVPAQVHDLDKLEVRCPPCHRRTFRPTPRPSWRAQG